MTKKPCQNPSAAKLRDPSWMQSLLFITEPGNMVLGNECGAGAWKPDSSPLSLSCVTLNKSPHLSESDFLAVKWQ